MAENHIYWISTTLLSLLYLSSAVTYVVKTEWVRTTIVGFGYPAYLVQVLITVKVLAVAVVLSRYSMALSDLAYAGMLFHLVLSAMAHLGVRKPLGALPALLGLIFLVTSFATQNAARGIPAPYALSQTAY